MTSAILINESDSGANYRSRIQKLLDNSASFTARTILRDRLNSASVAPRPSGERPFFRSFVTCTARVNDQTVYPNEPRVPRPMPFETLRSAESYLGRRMSDRRLSIADSNAYNVQLGMSSDPSKKVRITVDAPPSPRVPSSPESPSITFTFRVPKKTHLAEETVNATIRVPSPSSSDSAPSTPWKESSVYSPPDFTRQYSASSRFSKPESPAFESLSEGSPKVAKEQEIDSSYTRPFDRLSTARGSLGRSEPSSYTRRTTRPQTVFGEPSLDRKSSACDDRGSARPTFSVNLRSRPSDTPSPKKHCDRPSPRPSSMYDNFGRPDIPRVDRSRISPEMKKTSNGQTVTTERKFIFPRRKDSPKPECGLSDESSQLPKSPMGKYHENPLYKGPEMKDHEKTPTRESPANEKPSPNITPRMSAFKMKGNAPASHKIGDEGPPKQNGENPFKTPPRETLRTGKSPPNLSSENGTKIPPRDKRESNQGTEKAGFGQPSVPPRMRKQSPGKTATSEFEAKTANVYSTVNHEAAPPQSERKANVSQIRIIPIEVLDKPHVRIIPIHIEGDDKENRDRRSSTSSASSRRASSMAPNTARNGTVPEPPQRSKSYAMPSRGSFRRSRSRSSSREQTPTPNDGRYSSKRVLDLLNELSDESAPMPSNKKFSKTEAWNCRLAEEKKDEGNKYYRQKDYRRALACYTKAVELFPCASYYGNRAACYIMLGMYTQALQDARESVRCEPTFAKGHLRMGKCFLAMGDTVAARSAFNRSKELEPSNTTIEAELRTIDTLARFETDLTKAFDSQDYRKALYCCDRALDIAVFCRRFRVKKAECLAYLGRYPEAEEIVNDTLRSDSTDVDALLIRGICFYYQDNLDLAFSHFQQVLRLAPDHVKAREVYRKAKQLKTKKEEGNTAFKQGKLTDALSLYTDALAIDPLNKLTNAKLYYNRALVNSKLGKHQQAVQDCSEAVKLDEGYVKAFLLRAKSYSDLEKYEECVRDYETCMKLEKNANRETRRLLQEAKLALKKSKRKDYYKILGVDKNANEDDIKKAYRKRALVHHPDRHSSATEEERKEHEKQFKDLGEAYGVLSDPKKKARYDRGQDLDDDGHAEFDPQMFNAFFGAGPSPFGGFHFGGGSGGFHHGGFNFQF